MELSPKYYGLNSRVQLEPLSENHIAIVKRIKSRIIQKDALKLIETAQKIKAVNPQLKVSLLCNGHICSKSKMLLEENDIEVIC